jgi:hypothetical protein
MKEQFGLKPKERVGIYRGPYLDWFDREHLPLQYRYRTSRSFSAVRTSQ